MVMPAVDPAVQAARDGFGRWLRDEIDRRGWTVADFARAIGCYHSVAYRWVHGASRPRPIQCEQIARALGIDYDRVLDAAGHRPYAGASEIRSEVRRLVDAVDEPRLAAILPILRELAGDRDAARETNGRPGTCVIRGN